MDKLKFVYKKEDFSSLTNWAKIISEATVKEDFLLFQPLDKLCKIANNERIILAIDEQRNLIGSVVLWDIGEEWNEVGTVYVFPKYRGQGFGQELLRQAFAIWNGQNIMSTSKNSLFIHIALKSGMMAVTSDCDMKNVVPLTCVCDENDGVEDAKHCPFRNRECVFLISEKTAKRINHSLRNDEIVNKAKNYNSL